MTGLRHSTSLRDLVAVLVLAVAPAILLAPSLFGDRTYLPWDPAMFPPASVAQDQAARDDVLAQPAHLDVTELPVLVVPEIELAQEEMADGRFPAWNSYARFGAPLFANSLAALVYPPNWVLLVQGSATGGLALAAWLSFLIAGALTYFFLREVQLRPGPALFGALAFALSGTLTVNAHFYMRMNALIWLPGMLLACLRIAHTQGMGRIPGLVGLATCAGMTLLAGFPPYAAASLFVAGLYTLFLAARELRRQGAASAATLAAFALAGVVLGAGLAAVQLLPMASYFPESNRNLSPPANGMAAQGFDPIGLLGYVLRTPFGDPNQGTLPPYGQSPYAYLLYSRTSWIDADRPAGTLLYPVNYNFVEYTVFPGTLTVFLLALGASSKGYRFRMPAMVMLGALLLLSMAPGWLAWLYALPGFNSLPPLRFMGPAALLVAAIAAMGLDSVHRQTEHRKRRLAIALGGLIVAVTFGALAAWIRSGETPFYERIDLWERLATRWQGRLPGLSADMVATEFGRYGDAADARLASNLLYAAVALGIGSVWFWIWHRLQSSRVAFRVLTAATVVVTAVELGVFALPWNHGRELAPIDTTVHQFLREQRDAHRGTGGITVARAGKIAREPSDLPPGTLFPERIRDLHSYAFVDQWSHRLFRTLYGRDAMIREFWPRTFTDDERLRRPVFDLLGLRYLLSSEALQFAGRPVGPQLSSARGSFFVYERPNVLPRAFVVPTARVLDPEEPKPTDERPAHERGYDHGNDTPADVAVIRAMLDPALDPRAAVLVARADADSLPALPATTAGDANATPAADREVTFLRDTPTYVRLRIEAGQPGYLVLCDTLMSGWSATVNGAKTPLTRGNLFMRTLPLGSNALEVVFEYRAPGLRTGSIVTGATMILLLMLVGWWLVSRGSSREPAASV